MSGRAKLFTALVLMQFVCVFAKTSSLYAFHYGPDPARMELEQPEEPTCR